MSIEMDGETFQFFDEEEEEASTSSSSNARGKRPVSAVAPSQEATEANPVEKMTKVAKPALDGLDKYTQQDIITLLNMFKHMEKKRSPEENRNSLIAYHGFPRPVTTLGAILIAAENDGFISTKTLHKHMAENHARTVGYPPEFVVETNYQSASFEFARRNVVSLLLKTIPKTSKIRLTAQQRLAAAMMMTALDCDVTYEVKTSADYRRGDWESHFPASWCQARLEKDSLPSVRFCNYPPGIGKTAITTAAIMYGLCDDTMWSKFLAIQAKRNQAAKFNTYAGFSMVNDGSTLDPEVARLCICFVPEDTIVQWYETMCSAQFQAEKLYGKKIRIWNGVQKKSKEDRSLKVVAADGVPTIWIVSQEKRGMYAHTDFAKTHNYLIRVYDEGTAKAGTSVKSSAISQPVITLFVNATNENLLKLHRLTNHPLMDYIGSNYISMYDACAVSMNHHVSYTRASATQGYVAVSLASPPEWLRSATTKRQIMDMPIGIRKHTLSLRKANLQNALYGTDLIPMTVESMVSCQIRAPGNHTYTVEMKDDLLNVVAKNGGRGYVLLEQTVKAMEDWIKKHDAEWFKFLAARYRAEQNLPESYQYNASYERSMLDRTSSLLEKAKTLLNPDAEVEDPVTLENIPADRQIILGCCGNIADHDIIKEIIGRWAAEQGRVSYGHPKCPLCRGDLSKTKTVSARGAGSSSNESVADDTLDGMFGSCQSLFDGVPEDERLRKAIQAFREKKRDDPPGTLKGLGLVISLCCKAKPNLRALVVVKEYDSHHQGLAQKKEMLKQFQEYLPRNASADLVLGNSKTLKPVQEYKDEKNTNPRILFLVSTQSNRANLAGMDLGCTDVTFFENPDGDRDLVQAMGRSLRVKDVGFGPQAEKHVVLID